MNATTKTLQGTTPQKLQNWGAELKNGLNAAEKQLVKAAVSTLTAALKVATAELTQLAKGVGDLGKSIDDHTSNVNKGCPTPPSPADASHPSGSLKVDKDGVITTPGGYKIQATDQFNWKITGPDGKETDVWGDPHVKESDGGEWQFKKDSTFVLPDGTQINVATKPYGNGATVTGSLDILSGNDRVAVSDIDKGKGKVSDVTHDGFQHVNEFAGNDVFVMGKDSDDWSFHNMEITGSENQGDKITTGNSMATGSPNDAFNSDAKGHIKTDEDAGIITTPGGYKIQQTGQFNWSITGPDGKKTDVWGDPHVKESDGGEWQFKRDSTFVLPDGTRINVATHPYGNGATVSGDLDIINGNERVKMYGVDSAKATISPVSNDGFNAVNANKGDVFVMGKDTDDWTFQGKEVVGSENQGDVIKTGGAMDAGTTPSTQPTTQPGTKPTNDPSKALKDLTTRLQQMVDLFRSLSQVFRSLENLEKVLGSRTQQNPGIVPPARKPQNPGIVPPSRQQQNPGIVPPSRQPHVDGRRQVLERDFAQIGRMMDTLVRFQKLTQSINTQRTHMFQG